MAKLKICGCISLWLGDDDLFGYMFLNVLVRLVMTVVMIIEYIICLSPDETTLSIDIDGVQIGYQLAILGFLDILITVLCIMICVYSMRGTIIQSSERRLVSPLFSSYLLIHLIESLFCIVCEIILYSHNIPYNHVEMILFHTYSYISYIVSIIGIVLVILTKSISLTPKRLKFLLKSCCGCCIQDPNQLEDLSKIVSLFSSDDDLSLYDIVYGMKLLVIVEKYKSNCVYSMNTKESYLFLKRMPIGQFLFNLVTDPHFKRQ